jgi:hypothetical protein
VVSLRARPARGNARCASKTPRAKLRPHSCNVVMVVMLQGHNTTQQQCYMVTTQHSSNAAWSQCNIVAMFCGHHATWW